MKETTSKKVLILVNHSVTIYSFRRELVQRLVEDGYEVYLSCPQGDRIPELIGMGCHYVETEMERRGTNPFHDLKLLRHYRKIMKEIRPGVVLSYTIKPNVYGSMASSSLGIPQIANVTGLGTAIENGGLGGKFILGLCRVGMRKTKLVFFQNQSNLDFFRRHKVVRDNCALLPGSGVNLTQHCLEPYPEESGETVLLALGRLMKNKGTDELLGAARAIRERHPEVRFRLVGFCEDEYKQVVEEAAEAGWVEYCGNQADVHPFIQECHASLLPSYHEGMSNVLLESAAVGRPVLASDIPGCREIFDEGISGFSFRPKDTEDLIRAIEEFLALPYETKKAMGLAGRAKVEKEFDRQIVIEKYMEQIRKEVG